MKAIVQDIIMIVIMIFCLLFIKDVKLSSAITNIKEYTSSLKRIEELDQERQNLIDEQSRAKTSLEEVRTSTVSLDINSIYKAIMEISNVDKTKSEAMYLRITSGNPVEIGTYNEENSANSDNADGIRVSVVVDNISSFLSKLDKLQIPYVEKKIFYPQNKVLITYYTKEG